MSNSDATHNWPPGPPGRFLVGNLPELAGNWLETLSRYADAFGDFVPLRLGPKRAVLLKSMVNMAHELGLSVVAEGISDERDALELRQMGCEYVQSFMFGAPMPGDQVLKTLKEQYPLTQA